MKLSFFCGVVLTMLLTSAPAHASPVVAHLEFTGITNPDPLVGGDYASPYIFTVDGHAGVALVCVDALHTINLGQGWDAYVVTKPDLSLTGWGPNADQIFGELDILSGLVMEGYLTSNNTLRIDAQAEAWAVLDPAFSLTAGQAAALAALQAQDLTNVGWDAKVYIPVVAGVGQIQFSPAPEPPAVTLLAGGVGLLLIAVLAKRRRSKV